MLLIHELERIMEQHTERLIRLAFTMLEIYKAQKISYRMSLLNSMIISKTMRNVGS